MAEFVQRNIEEMVNELEQMQRVGIFEKHEIKRIIKKRKAYEYKLCRRTKQKEDYLAYAQYEINLLALVKKRREALGYRFKTMEIDIPIVKRIHRLLKIVTYRFQDDVKLWLSHIEFCKKRNEKILVSKIFARMLQVHSHRPALWIAAAKWEFEERQAATNARGLMQRGLRFNNTSKDLWLEYFKLELLLVDMAKKRQMLLKVTTTEDENISDAFLSGKVAELVFMKAMEAVSDVDFGLSFVKIVRLFDFGEKLEQVIMAYLSERHSENEQMWTERARHLLHASKGSKEGEKASLEHMEAAVLSVKTEKMWSCYLQFAWDLLSEHASTSRISHMLQLFDRARTAGFISEDWWLRWLDLLENVGLVKDADDVYSKALSCLPQSPAIWQKKLEFSIRCSRTEDAIVEVFNEAASKLEAKVTLSLWKVLLMYLIQKDSPATEDMLKRGASHALSEHTLAPLKEIYMDWARLRHGIRKARAVYKEMCKAPPLMLSLYEKYIAAESCQIRRRVKKIRRAYEEAARNFGSTNIDIWLQYIQLELSPDGGDCLRAGQLYWQALKSLDASLVDVFVSRHSDMQINCSGSTVSQP